MKWTTEFVWAKIESIIPVARVCGYEIPEALRACAVELFLSGETFRDGSYRAYVIAECIKELKTIGYLTTGTVDEDWM